MNCTLDQLISWLSTVMEAGGLGRDVEAKFRAALASQPSERADLRRSLHQSIRGSADMAWALGKQHEINAALRQKGFPSLMEMDDLIATVDAQRLKQASDKIATDEEYDVVKGLLDDLESGLTKRQRIAFGARIRDYEDRAKTT